MKESKAITADVVDAAIKIHKRLGPGLLESVYEMILAAELEHRGHVVERQMDISFDFDGLHFENGFRLDMLVDGEVVLELKSTEKVSPVHAKQLKTYLVLTGKSVGLVLNFGLATMMDGVKRVVNGYVDESSRRADCDEGLCRGECDDISRRGAEAQRVSRNLCASASLREDQVCGESSRRGADGVSGSLRLCVSA